MTTALAGRGNGMGSRSSSAGTLTATAPAGRRAAQLLLSTDPPPRRGRRTGEDDNDSSSGDGDGDGGGHRSRRRQPLPPTGIPPKRSFSRLGRFTWLTAVGVGFGVVRHARFLLANSRNSGGGNSIDPFVDGFPRYLEDDSPPPLTVATGISSSKNKTSASLEATATAGAAGKALSSEKPPSSSSSPPLPSLAFCLLIKDDNDILNEWLAYHYHVLNLRRIVVAVDPTALTSPAGPLERWNVTFGLTSTLWTDVDYMPAKFVEGDYSKVPNLMGKDVRPHPDGNGSITTGWHGDATSRGWNFTQEEIRRDVTQVNNHRYRQAVFVSKCYRLLRGEAAAAAAAAKGKAAAASAPMWTAHIDTDEYVVVNPHLRRKAHDVDALLADTGSQALKKHLEEKRRRVLGVAIPKVPTAGSLVKFWMDMGKAYPPMMDRDGKVQHYSSKSCLVMPTLLFGAHEDGDGTGGDDPQQHAGSEGGEPPRRRRWNVTAFETLRWKHYGSLEERYNGYPKTIVDVSAITSGHEIFRSQPGKVKNIHQPLPPLGMPEAATEAYCPGNMGLWYPKKEEEGKGGGGSVTYRMPFAQAALYRPFAIQHYLGSMERYLARADVRRSEAVFRRKARIVNGTRLTEEEDMLMEQWPEEFVREHGTDKVLSVLGDYVVVSE